jgi:hypothetical protein
MLTGKILSSWEASCVLNRIVNVMSLTYDSRLPVRTTANVMRYSWNDSAADGGGGEKVGREKVGGEKAGGEKVDGEKVGGNGRTAGADGGVNSGRGGEGGGEPTTFGA